MTVPWLTPPPLVETMVFPDAVSELCGVAGGFVIDGVAEVEEVADVVVREEVDVCREDIEVVEEVEDVEEEADVDEGRSTGRTLKPFENPLKLVVKLI